MSLQLIEEKEEQKKELKYVGPVIFCCKCDNMLNRVFKLANNKLSGICKYCAKEYEFTEEDPDFKEIKKRCKEHCHRTQEKTKRDPVERILSGH